MFNPILGKLLRSAQYKGVCLFSIDNLFCFLDRVLLLRNEALLTSDYLFFILLVDYYFKLPILFLRDPAQTPDRSYLYYQ